MLSKIYRRRFLVCILSMMIMMTAIFPINTMAAGNLGVTIGSVTGQAGGSVVVPVSLSNIPNDGLVGTSIIITFDSTKLTLTGVSAGAIVPTATDVATNINDVIQSPGKAKIFYSDANGGLTNTYITTSGVLANLTFSIDASASGTYAFGVDGASNATENDADLTTIPYTGMNVGAGTLTITTPTPKVDVSVGQVEGQAGGSVTVPISLSNIPSVGVVATSIIVTYDNTKLTLTGVSAGGIVPTAADVATNINDVIQSPGKVKLFYFDHNAGIGNPDTHITTNGVLANLTFSIDASANGEYNFDVDPASEITDNNVNTIGYDGMNISPGKVTVTSAPVAVTSITVTGASNASSVQNGSTLQMSAAVLPANATNPSVTWSVTNGTGSATVDSSSGLLTGTGNGTVTVTATANDGSNVTGTLQVTVTAAPVTYTLTYNAGANGSISGTTPQTVNSETTGSAITAVANTGYHFVSWSDGVLTATRTDSNVTGDINVTASFAPDAPVTYTLTYIAGPNGSITGTTLQTVNSGANGTAVTAVPNPGYQFVSWSDGGTTATRTDSNVTGNLSVTATFAIDAPPAPTTYTLNYVAGANGTITGTASQTVNSGSNGTAVTAVPDAGYHFVSWSDGGTTATRTDNNVIGNLSVTATFAIDAPPAPTTYTLNYAAGANGTITGTASQTVNSGSNGTAVTAVPDAGYHFASWSDGGTTATRTDNNVIGNLSVTATFAIDAPPAPTTYTLNYAAGANGTITGTASQTVNSGANGTAVTAVPNAGCQFVSWSDGNTSATRTDSNVTGNLSVTATFAAVPPTTYTLAYVAGTNGTITGTSTQTVNSGGNGTAVTAVPNSGYQFVSWSDGNTSATRTDSNVAENLSVTATFAAIPPTTYTLNYAAGSNGTITGTVSQTVNSGSNGTAVTAVPNSGYQFVNWSDGNTSATRTDSNVAENLSVTATFAAIPPTTYTLNYGAGTNGTITGTASQTVNSGSNGTAVTAVPDAGYHFVSWSDGGTTATRTDNNVIGNLSVTATFAIDAPPAPAEYTLTYGAGSNGTITGTASQTVNSGSNGTAVTAVPNSGYQFVSWSDGNTSATRTDTNVAENLSVTATFAAIPPSPITYTLNYIAGTNGTITGTLSQSVTSGANGTAVTAVPNAGYQFVSWSDGNTSATRTDTNVAENLSVTATFAAIPPTTYTLNYAAGSNGTITGTASQTVNSGSNGTAVTAVPNSGYQFVNWSDGNTSATRTDSNVAENLSVTATFAAIPPTTYTLNYVAGTNGTITGTASQTVNSGSNGTAVTAVPDAGYHFVSWSDGNTSVTRTDSNVTRNLSVTATFAAILPTEYTLTYAAGTNGTITGTVAQTVYSGANGTAVTAVPNAGYHFVSWSDGVTTATRTESNVTGNLSVTAAFAIDAPAPVAVTNITVTGADNASSVQNGSTLPMSASVLPANATNPSVTWSVTNGTGSATIDSSSGLLTGTGNGTVTVTATANDGSNVTGTLQVTVNPAPVAPSITTQPTNQTVTEGQSVTFSVVAAGDAPLSYQWKKDGTEINGATSATLSINSAQLADAGSYSCCVSNATGNVTSSAATLTVNPAPVAPSITNQPTSQTVTAGQPVTFSVVATGDTPLSYQWKKDGTNISGATSATLSINSAQLADAGSYSCNVSNAAGNVTSSAATLTFAPITYTLNYAAGANGTITGTVAQTVYSGANGTAVTAVPNAGYHFVSWSDGVTTATRTESNVTGNLSVTVAFAIDAPAPVAVTNITVTGADNASSVQNGSTLPMSASVLPANATNPSVTWSVTNGTGSATIDSSSGLLTGTGNGTVTVTATAHDGSGVTGTLQVTVTAAPVAPTLSVLTLSGNIPELTVGEAVYSLDNLSLSGTDQYGAPYSLSGQSVQWNLVIGSSYANLLGSTLTPVAAGSGTVTANVYGVTSNTLGFNVLAAPSSSGGSSGGGGGSYNATTPTTVTGSVVDGTTGTQVSNITATVTVDSNGNDTISMNAAQAISLNQPDGSISPLGDISKVAITSSAGSPVTISADGTIQVPDLAKGTDNNFNMTYDLGNGQKITIGTMKIKIDSSGAVAITTTLIDPYGIITDATTGKALEGVSVTLYYAFTDRNKVSGKTPDTVVPLPSIAGFKPNNNQDPQISDANGAYGFMVFPATDYYIVATKDGYNQYTSPTIAVEQEIVKWDFKMNPTTSGVTRLAGSTRVDTALAIAKASYPGKVDNVILATEDNYPDALAGSVLAYKLKAPILLVGSTDADQEKVLDYMNSNLDPAGTVYILGGSGAISTDLEGKVTAQWPNITRLGGADRYDTSVKIADQLEVKTGTPVVLVSGENYPDALSISSSAAEMQSPILLVQKDGISDTVKQEMAVIKPTKVYIIGQQGVLSTAVEDQAAQITGLTPTNIVRIGGADRYATSLAVAQYFNLTGNVCIATGNNFPDALAGSVYAANHNAPIILADGSLSDQVMNYLQAKKLTGATLFGGEAVVSQGIEQQLEKIIGQ